MKRKLTILTSVICAFLILAGGCASRTAATVNGERIYMSEVEEKINQGLAQYGTDNEGLEDYIYQMTGDAEEAKNEANAYRDSILDNVILTKIMMQKASELGLDQITDEERDQAIAEAESTLATYKDFYINAAEEAAENDPTIDVDSYAEQQYQEFLDMSGITEESYKQASVENVIMGKVYDYYMEQCEVTDQDYMDYYNQLLEEQKAMDEEDPEQAMYFYLNNGYDVNVYVPSNASKDIMTVEHILIGIDDETLAEINDVRYSGDEDAEEKAQELTDAALEKIKPEAEEVLKQVKEGADFEKLMKEKSMDYHEDSENTYDVYEGSGFVESFVEASMKLKDIGDISDLTASEYGWHIIKLVGHPESGPVPFEDIQHTITYLVDEEQEAMYWQETLSNWMEEADVDRISFIQ